MKLSEIVTHLGYTLPRYTDKFSALIPYTSITASNGVVTVTTASPHGLTTGKYISANGMKVKRDVISLVHNGRGTVTATTDVDHDLTDGWQDTVTIEGANQAAFNGTFEFLHQPNRRTFTFKIPDTSAPSNGSGPMKFVEYLETGIDGGYQITVVDATTFQFTIPNSNFSLQSFYGQLSRGQRVLGVVNVQRFINMYEDQEITNYWAAVCMDDATTSKNRNVPSDATSYGTASVDIRQPLIEPFSVYVLCPCKDQVAALNAIDDMYTIVRNALFKSLLGMRFNSDLDAEETSGVVFIGHGGVGYTKLWYIHQFRFETYKEITLDDTIYNTNSIAYPTHSFRDITLTFENEHLTPGLNNTINLDDVPLT